MALPTQNLGPPPSVADPRYDEWMALAWSYLKSSTSGVTGVAQGGTGISSYAIGDILYASAVTTLSKLPIGAANKLLGVNAAGTAPEYKGVTASLSGNVIFTAATTPINPSGNGQAVIGTTAAGGLSLRGQGSVTDLNLTNSAGTSVLTIATGSTTVNLSGIISVAGHTIFEGVTSTGATGTGKLVYDTSPTLVTPVLGAASGTSLSLSGLTVSQAVFTDGSKNLVSNAITGSGSVAMSASPTFTGTILAAAATFSGTVATQTLLDVGTGVANGGTRLFFRDFSNSGTFIQRIYLEGSSLAAGIGQSSNTFAIGTPSGSGSGATITPIFSINMSTSAASLTGALSVTGHATLEGVTSTGATGTGKIVFDTSPVLVTPALGTPVSGLLTNCTIETGTWTVTFNGWTNVGTPTVTATYAKIGKMVHLNAVIVPATSVLSIAGTSYITGLPYAPANNETCVWADDTSHIALGTSQLDTANSGSLYSPSTGGANSHTFSVNSTYLTA